MIVKTITDSSEDTGLSVEEYRACMQLLSSEVMQKFCLAQRRGLLVGAVRDINPSNFVSDAEYRVFMQRLFNLAVLWSDIAEAADAYKQENS